MTEVRSFRDKRDLVELIAALERRVSTLESSRRIGATSLDGGELTIRSGDIVVRNDNDKEVTRIMHGNIPIMRYRPANTASDDFQLVTFGWESDDGAAYQACVQTADGAQDGGKLLLMREAVYLSKQMDDPGVNEVYLSMGQYSAEEIRLQGVFSSVQRDELEAVVTFRVDVTAGFGAYLHTFDFPYDTVPIVMYSLFNSAGAVTHSLTALSTTGFTISWSGTLAKVLFFSVYRRAS